MIPPGRQTDRKTRAYRLGHLAETAAALLLRLKGYRVLARRYRTPVGEIDLIAKRRGVVVMVEVKARTTRAAAEVLGARQRRRIERAAEAYVASHPGAENCDIRFDLIAVGPGLVPRHIPNAWIVGD